MLSMTHIVIEFDSVQQNKRNHFGLLLATKITLKYQFFRNHKIAKSQSNNVCPGETTK